MASIKFLNNITLVGNQLELARIQNLGSAPTVYGDGQLYYDTGLNKLRLRENGSWVSIQTGTDGDTTYDLDVAAGTTKIRLTGSDGTTDDVEIAGSGLISVTRTNSAKLTLSTTATSNVGTVTSVSGGTGITITGSGSVTPTVNIDYAGTDNAILAATAATPAGADTLWFSDATDNTIKKALISAMPGFGADGTVTSVATSNGTFVDVSGGTITTTGTITADLSATGSPGATTFLRGDNVWATPAGAYTDWKLKGDGGTAVDIGDGETVNFIGGAGLDAVAASGSPNTLTYSLDLNELTAATPVAADFIAGVDSTDNSTKKFLISNLPFTNTSGTVTSVGLSMPSAFSVADSPVTSSGTIAVTGAGTASQVVLGNGSLGTLTVGTVTSVSAGAGLTISSGSSTVNPTIAVDYSSSGLIADAQGMSGSAESDDEILIGDDSASGAVRSAALTDIPLNVLGAPNGNLTMSSNKITSLSNGTASTDAVNLGQVQSLVAGVGVFQGGYNASTNSPAIAGSSNVALTTGDFFVVTTDGTIAFNGSSVDVEVGDMIYANADISASSNPAATAYSIVIQDQNIAGTGATDGATEKGVAGFSSASFSATANGFITIKSGGISNAMLANTPNYIIGTDSDINTSGVTVIDELNMTDGVIQSHSTRTLPDATASSRGVAETATQAEVDAGTSGAHLMVTPATLKAHLDKQGFAGTYPASNSTSWTVAHGLGTADVIVQVYEVSSGATVYVDVIRDTSSPYSLTLSTAQTQTANSLRVLVSKVR
mgnify:FL=1|jgi:hypothetical protein|tara:strand:- start:273 stop:2591 length:2319 start_codon:yes stop_codon:yes gene_type:complete